MADFDDEHAFQVPDINDNFKPKLQSQIDKEIDFDEEHENVGCIELTTSSKNYGRFKTWYFFIALAEQFGLYWAYIWGVYHLGIEFLEYFIVFYAFAALISSITSPFIGRLSDRYGRKRIIQITIFMQSVPYIVLAINPDKFWHFLFSIPLIGFCGSIQLLTGVMKSYVVDCLPKKLLISGFAKLLSIYGGAGVLSSILISIIIANELKNKIIDDDTFEFTSRILFAMTVFLYLFSLFIFSCFVPESLTKDMRLPYDGSNNPCHGIKYAFFKNKIVITTAFVILFIGFAQIGIFEILIEILSMDFVDNDGYVDLMSVLNDDPDLSSGNSTAIDISAFLMFLMAMSVTLIAAPCCIKCCLCGRDINKLCCTMALMTISFAMIIYLLLSDAWYTIIVATAAGIFFACGEIGFAFLYGMISKFMNSKQYGISYGLLHSMISLCKAIAPYLFFTLFDSSMFGRTSDHKYYGRGKGVLIIGIVMGVIGVILIVFLLKKQMKKYKDSHHHHLNDHVPNKKSEYNEGGFSEWNTGFHEQVERRNQKSMVIPQGKRGGGGGGSGGGGIINIIARNRGASAPKEDVVEMQPYDYEPSNVSSHYVVGQRAPQYASDPYVAPPAPDQVNYMYRPQAQPNNNVQQYALQQINSNSQVPIPRPGQQPGQRPIYAQSTYSSVYGAGDRF